MTNKTYKIGVTNKIWARLKPYKVLVIDKVIAPPKVRAARKVGASKGIHIRATITRSSNTSKQNVGVQG